MMKVTRVAIYIRVSSEEQGERYGPQMQLNACLEMAGLSSEKDALVYRDLGISGSVLDRPGLAALRRDARDNLFSRLFVYSEDRLSRNTLHLLLLIDELEKNGISIHFVTGEKFDRNNPSNQLLFTMKAAIAEYERSTIAQRTKRGRETKIKSGKILKGYPIFGYTFNKEKSTFEINEQEAQVVRLMYRWLLDGMGVNSIAKKLTALGYRTKKGKTNWHRQVCHQILRNPAYMGKFVQNKYDTTGMVGNKFKPKAERVKMAIKNPDEWVVTEIPAIVDKQTWEQAQDILETARRRFAGKPKRTYLLSGLLRCAICGNPMHGRMQNNFGNPYPIYTCRQNYSGAKNPGCNRTIKCDEIDNEIWSIVVEWATNPETISKYVETVDNTNFEKDLERINAEIEKAQRGLDNLIALVADGTLTTDVARGKIEEAKQRLHDMKKEKERLEEKLKAGNRVETAKATIEEITKHYVIDGNLGIEDKKTIIRRLIREIKVGENTIDIVTI